MAQEQPQFSTFLKKKKFKGQDGYFKPCNILKHLLCLLNYSPPPFHRYDSLKLGCKDREAKRQAGNAEEANILTASIIKEDFVIQAKAKLWHSRQENPHLDGSNNFTAQNIPIGTNLKLKGGEGRALISKH